jgi:myo-inositol 2-dehydrogenase/D-chiro-inositol 1-dehydrogenase
MSKLRVGFIGAGGIAGAHWPHLQKRSDAVELAGVADVNADAAAALAVQAGMPFHTTDARELLARVDAVLICIPTHLHAEIAAEALRAGVAVFCEKPLARTLEQAETIARAERESGTPLQVGFVRRFDEEWLAWRDVVLQEKIGRPVVWRDVAAYSGPPNRWFNQDEQGGGPFLDGCIHNLDFALFTFGPAQWVFCNGRTLNPDHTAIDTGTATVRFQSGDELLLAWSWGLPQGCGGGRVFEFLGPNGTLTWPHDGEVARFVLNTGGNESDVPFPGDALQQGFARQMDEFIEVAQGKAKPRGGSAEGIASLKLALAIIESARSGQVVVL